MNLKKLIPSSLKDFYSNVYYFFYTKKNRYNILSSRETVNQIIDNKLSVSRFGDGEFKWMLNIKQKSFQDENEKLSERLKEILISEDKNIMICIPDAINKLEGYRKKSKKFWKNFVRWHGKDIKNYLSNEKIYGNTNFTRWYMEYANKDKTLMKNRLEERKKIWNERNIVIVEGKSTKMGVGNDLFKNTKSIQRIICPSVNAFNKYDEILNECKKVHKSKMFLIALGPTATVLAYDLARLGYQAIDLGHIDIEYEWYLKDAQEKTAVVGKAVNEVGNMIINNDTDDKDYLDSIICEIGDE